MSVEIFNLKDAPNTIRSQGTKYYYFFHNSGSIKKSIDVFADKSVHRVFCKGAIIASGDDTIELTINIHNSVVNSKARVHVKTYLTGASRFDFDGCIFISSKAHGSDSYLQQDNLVSSDNVVCNTSPQLEIKANDVRASHGATVGNFNSDELFYFESRGITRERAKSELANGFLTSVYGKHRAKVLEYFKTDSLL